MTLQKTFFALISTTLGTNLYYDKIATLFEIPVTKCCAKAAFCPFTVPQICRAQRCKVAFSNQLIRDKILLSVIILAYFFLWDLLDFKAQWSVRETPETPFRARPQRPTFLSRDSTTSDQLSSIQSLQRALQTQRLLHRLNRFTPNF